MYARMRLISGGTFSAGAGPPRNDWSTQFDDASSGPYALATVAGEFQAGVASSYGVCVDYAVKTPNPVDISVYVEASAGAGTLQVHVNGVVTEYTASGPITVSLKAGANLLRFIRATGPITVAGKIFDSMNLWTSLYRPGEDPFMPTPGATGTGVKSLTASTVDLASH